MKLRTIQRLENSEGGFALAAVIFVLVLLGVLAVTSFITTGDERRASHGMRESAKAFYAAEAGVNLVLAEWDLLQYDTLFAGPGSTVDLGWRTLSENGATHHAVMRRVDNGGSATYALSVEGRGAGAQRVINLLFTMQSGLNITAAIRGGVTGGTDVEDPPGVSGLDVNPGAWGAECAGTALDDVPGLEWGSTPGSNSNLQGDPPFVVDPTINNDSLFTFGDLTFDSLAVLANITLTGDPDQIRPQVFAGSCDTSVEWNWGAPENGPGHPCYDYLPIIHSANDLRIRNGVSVGQGLLLVDGDLRIEDSFRFYGIIMVRGDIRFEDTGVQITGGVITREMDRVRDGAGVQYSSCVTDRILASLGLGGDRTRLSWSEVL